jgi:hypothetical protein
LTEAVPLTSFTEKLTPRYDMTTEIEETSTPKVVNWDVAEERDFEKLKVEMDEHKDKMMALESKAVLLRSKLDKKVELSEGNASLGVKVVALEYKTAVLQLEAIYNHKIKSLMPKSDCFGLVCCWPKKHSKLPESRVILNAIYLEFEEETVKNLGLEGWTLRAVHGRGGGTIHYYFSRPL